MDVLSILKEQLNTTGCSYKTLILDKFIPGIQDGQRQSPPCCM